MNERIKLLAEQAQQYAEYVTPQGLECFDMFKAKFAELIVRECVSIVAKRKDQAIDDSWNVDEAMCVAEMDLLEHFGVEE